jgi:maleylacetoacetate isomerase
MRLYSYWRSSAAYRIRIALNLKGIAHEIVPVHLVRGGGEHRQPDYLSINPQGLLPSLQLETGEVLTQSLAILEYLDELQPQPPLLPADPAGRAQARAVAQAIAVDLHPVNNLRISQYLRGALGQDDAGVTAWMKHWMIEGFAAVEQMVGDGPFSFGDTPTQADLCIVPQMYNARRYGVDLARFPRLVAIDAYAATFPAFQAALPESQPDAE